MASCALTTAIITFFSICDPSDAGNQFRFLNGGSSAFDIQWLQHGKQDPGEGITTGFLPAASGIELGVAEQMTTRGHAFRLRTDDGRTSSAFVHEGGSWNIVNVQERANGSVEIETLGSNQLRRLALGDSAQQRSPKFGFSLPVDIVREIAAQFSPEKDQPQEIASMLHGDDQCNRYGSIHDEYSFDLIIMSSLPYPLEVRWLWQEQGADDLPKFETPSDLYKVSRASGALSAAVTSSPPCAVRLKVKTGQVFALATQSASRASVPFAYSGELHLVVVTEAERSSGILNLEQLDEDAVKIFFNSVATQCGESLAMDDTFWDCFEKRATLPISGLHLPAEISRRWFERLWGSVQHWQLCSYQAATIPLETRSFKVSATLAGGTRELKGDVLRKSPLVVAVHNVTTEEECRALHELVGDPKKLDRAHMLGGGYSKDRRTLSKNLYPIWNDHDSVLTSVTQRFYDIARQASGFELYPPGQEPVNWLFYKPGYEYRPHCDGACGAANIQRGQRVATSLVYCSIADKGGGTVFPNDGLKLEPTVGMMLFFTYNPDPQSLTRHAACPVLRGQKTTATQWFREGVTEEMDWLKVQRIFDSGSKPEL